MTPKDLGDYLKVLAANNVGAATVKLVGGDEFSVTFVPSFPDMVGHEPEPGGWKSPKHLDNPEDLRDDNSYKGTLP